MAVGEEHRSHREAAVDTALVRPAVAAAHREQGAAGTGLVAVVAHKAPGVAVVRIHMTEQRVVHLLGGHLEAGTTLCLCLDMRAGVDIVLGEDIPEEPGGWVVRWKEDSQAEAGLMAHLAVEGSCNKVVVAGMVLGTPDTGLVVDLEAVPGRTGMAVGDSSCQRGNNGWMDDTARELSLVLVSGECVDVDILGRTVASQTS